MQAVARAARTYVLRPAGQSVRRMSGALSHEEEVKQVNLWKAVTFAGELFFSLRGRRERLRSRAWTSCKSAARVCVHPHVPLGATS